MEEFQSSARRLGRERLSAHGDEYKIEGELRREVRRRRMISIGDVLDHYLRFSVRTDEISGATYDA